jgi:5-methylcytosine-specific restriction endonuclease McrA
MKRTPLKADPEKTRQWVQKSQAKNTLQSKPKARVRVNRDEQAVVHKRSKGKCIVCLEQPSRDVHHVLPQRLFPELADVAANMVGVCRKCHARHENAFRRIYMQELPDVTVALVADLGGPAEAYFVRTYPWREDASSSS